MGGCLLKPQSMLLPQARASMVSRGRFWLEKDGISVHIIRCVDKKINNFLFSDIYSFLTILLLIDT